MTRNETIERFIKNQIDDIKGNIPYALGSNMEMNKGEWIRWSNEQIYNKAFGALVYAYCYTKELDREQYEMLMDDLRDVYFAENRKSFNIK